MSKKPNRSKSTPPEEPGIDIESPDEVPGVDHDAPVPEIAEKPPEIKTDAPMSAGRVVFVSGSKFSKPFMAQAAQDFRAGKVKAAMQMQLPDGQTITAGPTYETTMSSELLQMIKSGVLQASNFGKLAKRG